MTVRYMKDSDLTALAEIDSEPEMLPSIHDPLTEAALVLVDDQGKPMMACVAVRTAQMYLVASKKEKPFEGSRALRTLETAMGRVLKAKGYGEAFAFISDPRFGHALEKRFGWIQTKLSWMKRL